MSRPDDSRIDELLAAFTDDLLAGQEGSPPEAIDPLGQVVRQLHRAVGPGTGASPVFRARLNQRIQREWTLQYGRRRLALWRERPQWVVAAAAGLGAALVAAAWLLARGGAGDDRVEGTALGSSVPVILAVAGVVALGLVMVWYWRHK